MPAPPDTNIIVRRTEPPPRIVVCTDIRAGWSSLQSAILEEVPHHDVYEGDSGLFLSTNPRHSVRMSIALHGKRESGAFAPNSTWLVYRHGAADTVVENPHEVHHCRIDGPVVEEVAGTLFKGDPAHIELVPGFGIGDPVVTLLMANVRQAMELPEAYAGKLYSDYLARVLSHHVLRKYAVQQDSRMSRERLGRFGINVARTVIEYMRENLERDIDICELAAISRYSPTHFARLFKATFGCAPHRYLTGMRLDRAKQLIVSTDLPIGQIGALCGFPDHAYFSALFRRHVGVSPVAYRSVRGLR